MSITDEVHEEPQQHNLYRLWRYGCLFDLSERYIHSNIKRNLDFYL